MVLAAACLQLEAVPPAQAASRRPVTASQNEAGRAHSARVLSVRSLQEAKACPFAHADPSLIEGVGRPGGGAAMLLSE